MKFINPDKVFLIATIICNSVPVKSFAPLSQRSRLFVHHGIPHHAAASTTFEYVSTDPKNEFVGSVLKFPPPLNQVDRLKRAATFWVSTVPIVSNYYANLGKLKFLEIHGMPMPIDESERVWNYTHEKGAQQLADIISDLKGFYVKAAQIVATRGDLFPKQYVDALNQFADNLDPMPVSMSKAIITQELLLKDGETFEDVFSQFDEEPLGAASIAQVHRAVLSEKYGFREVAVKIQRPSIESKLMGDIANLKTIAKLFRHVDASPVDYYTIFSELENQLQDEFDFSKEAKAMDQIYDSLATAAELPIVMPRSVPELVTRRVLVMDFIKGTPLSRMQKKMEESGIKPGSMKSKLFGRKFVESLTEVFGRTILGTGLFHADPHPGNIMITDDGDIGLIDFGQVKQLTPSYRDTIAKIIIALDERKGAGEDDFESNELLGKLILDLGVELHKDAKHEAGAAIAMWLFDGSVENLPGGYDVGELSPDSPVKEIKEFPQDLVLVARSVVMIKAFSNRFQIGWSLAEKWAPIARKMIHDSASTDDRYLLHDYPFAGRVRNLKKRIKKRSANFAKTLLVRMPPRIRSLIASALIQ